MSMFTRSTLGPETWTPEGTTVAQRYRALEGATVLVYTTDADRAIRHYAAACLGCTYRADQNTAGNPMSEAEAAQAANSHAAACRAMPRGVPARLDEADAADLVRTQLRRRRTHSTHADSVRLSDFNALRVDLQRPTAWIKAQLTAIAAAEPDFLTATPASSGTRFTVQPFADRT
ncbi:hypothetical protein [Streptomyces triculaminicus]|uniref:hypothetical protein n=1 Tax=Streptomyces triculaminicus TaxID=2816232 RepID=UPI0037CFD0C3